MKLCQPALALATGLAVSAVSCATEQRAASDAYHSRLEVITSHDVAQSIVVTDRHGRPLATLANEGYRHWIPLHEIPGELRMATVATEDESFFSNGGVDPGAVARAALQNAQAGQTVSGASTITMQLVRMVAFGHKERFEQTLERKIREAQLASELAERFSKDEILEAYLNIAYFGHGAYGVEAAANIYFGASARDLTLGQATLLAGLPQSPAYLDPFENRDAALRRRRTVLDRMVTVGVLTPERADAAAAEPLDLGDGAPDDVQAPYFVDFIRRQLPDVLGPELAARGGFTVTGTIDIGLDRALADIAREHVVSLRDKHDMGDAAVVAVRPLTGEIVALVGGLDYSEAGAGQVNVALSRRQPGSAFKPIVYLAAMEKGWTPASLLWDIPYEFGGADPASRYVPENYDRRYRGPVRVRQALGSSLNAATIGLAADVGLPAIHDMAARLGVDLGPDPDAAGLSVALGGVEVSLLDLTGAYAALAAGGRYARPAGIIAIESFRGGDILATGSASPARAAEPAAAWLVTDVLRDREARRDAFGEAADLVTAVNAAVKTGTSTDFRDNVTIGYSPYLAIGVWTGNKDGRPMRDVTGITGAAPIWHDAMELVAGDTNLLFALGDGHLPEQGFPVPEGVVATSVCDLGTLEVDGTCNARDEFVSAASLSTGRAQAYAWFSSRGGCSAVEDFGAAGAALMLTTPVRADLAAQVGSWARARGIAVAAAPCAGGPVTVAALPEGLPLP